MERARRSTPNEQTRPRCCWVEWWHLPLMFAVGLFLSFIAAVWARAMLFLTTLERGAHLRERFGAR